MTVHVRKTKITTLITIGQPGMIDTQQMKNGGIEVMNVHGARSPFVFVRFDHVAILVRKVISVVVRLPVGDAWLDSSPAPSKS